MSRRRAGGQYQLDRATCGSEGAYILAYESANLVFCNNTAVVVFRLAVVLVDAFETAPAALGSRSIAL